MKILQFECLKHITVTVSDAGWQLTEGAWHWRVSASGPFGHDAL